MHPSCGIYKVDGVIYNLMTCYGRKSCNPAICAPSLMQHMRLVNVQICSTSLLSNSPHTWVDIYTNWRRGNDIPTDSLFRASSVIIKGMVYCGYSDDIVQYNPVSGEWSKLPSPPVQCFAMTSFNDQLVLADCKLLLCYFVSIYI